MQVAQEIVIQVFGMIGQSGGRLAEIAESLRIPSAKTARRQESQILVGHIICELADNAMTGV